MTQSGKKQPLLIDIDPPVMRALVKHAGETRPFRSLASEAAITSLLRYAPGVNKRP